MFPYLKCVFPISLLTTVGISVSDPSGVTCRDGSNLISSLLGVCGVKCPSILVYCLGVSSPGSLLTHSLCFKGWHHPVQLNWELY